MFPRISKSNLVVSIVLVLAFVVSLFPSGVIPAKEAEAAPDLPWTWLNPLPTGSDLYDVAAVDGTRAWAVGVRGALLSWNGSKWSTVQTGFSGSLTSVTALDATHAWACGSSNAFFVWNGTAWKKKPGPSIGSLQSIFAVAPNSVWVVSQKGKVARWNGTAWKTWNLGTGSPLSSVFALAKDNVWVGDVDGRITHFDGTSWTQQRSGGLPPVDAISGYDETHVWAVSGAGILRWNGSEWADEYAGDTRLLDITSMGYAETYACGESGSVLRWNGTGWDPQGVPATNAFWGISATGGDVIAVGDAGTVIRWDGVEWTSDSTAAGREFVDSETIQEGVQEVVVAATGDGHLYVTVFGHLLGVSVPPPAYDDITGVGVGAFPHILLTTESGLLLSTDGKGWGPETIPTTAPLYDVDVLYGTQVAYAVGAMGTVLSRNGNSWIQEEVLTEETLRRVEILDETHIWAVGDNGTILFFDGYSWYDYSVATTETLQSVMALDPTHVYAVGTNGTFCKWNGTAWKVQQIANNAVLYDVDALSPTNITVSAGSGMLYTWDGSSWSERLSPTTKSLYTVDMVRDGVFYVGGSNGAMLMYGRLPAVALVDTINGRPVGAGTSAVIEWNSSDAAVSFKVKYSLDGGKTWNPVSPEATDANYMYFHPPAAKNGNYPECVVKVQAYDSQGKLVGSDKSKPFAIQSLRLETPEGPNLSFRAGDTVAITWYQFKVYDDKPVARLKIMFTKNGVDWVKVFDTSNPAEIPAGRYDWTAPDPGPNPKTKCKIKIQEFDAEGNLIGMDVSNAPFTITR